MKCFSSRERTRCTARSGAKANTDAGQHAHHPARACVCALMRLNIRSEQKRIGMYVRRCSFAHNSCCADRPLISCETGLAKKKKTPARERARWVGFKRLPLGCVGQAEANEHKLQVQQTKRNEEKKGGKENGIVKSATPEQNQTRISNKMMMSGDVARRRIRISHVPMLADVRRHRSSTKKTHLPLSDTGERGMVGLYGMP